MLITGCGPIGLFAVGICRAAGASRIIATDVNEKRLALARTMGANDAVHPKDAERLALSTGDVGSLAARLSGSRWHLLTPRHHNYFFQPAVALITAPVMMTP